MQWMTSSGEKKTKKAESSAGVSSTSGRFLFDGLGPSSDGRDDGAPLGGSDCEEE